MASAMATTQSEVMTGNVTVKNLVDRLSKVENLGQQSPNGSGRTTTTTGLDAKRTAGAGAKLSQQQVVAAFPYQAVQDDELTLNVDDIVEIIEEVEDGWNRGRLLRSGKIGMYPTNFTVPKVASTSTTSATPKKELVMKKDDDQPVLRKGAETEPKAVDRQPSLVLVSGIKEEIAQKTKEMAKVKFTYEPQNSDELRLNEVGILINILRKDCGDIGWMEGELNGRKGVFPDNFIEIIHVPITTPSGVHISTLHKLPHSASSKPPLNAPSSAAASTVQPPAVPAKPLKPKVLDTVPPVTSNAATAPPSNSAPSIMQPSSTPNKSTNFAALREKLNKELKPLQPDQMGRAKSEAAPFDVRPSSMAAEPGWSDETSGDQLSSLNHVTKDRPRPPNAKRPTSMMVLKKKESTENLLENNKMTMSEYSGSQSNGASSGHTTVASTEKRSEPNASAQHNSGSGFTVTASIGNMANSSSTASSTNKVTAMRSAFGTESEKTGPTPVTTSSAVSAVSHSSHSVSVATHKEHPAAAATSASRSSEFVSRAEYNLLLDRIALLEQRLAILEKR